MANRAISLLFGNFTYQIPRLTTFTAVLMVSDLIYANYYLPARLR